MKTSVLFAYSAAIVFSFAAFISRGHANTFTDDFHAGIDSTYWTIAVSEGNTVAWDSVNQRVLMTQGPVDSTSGANLIFNFAATGDFEIRVDYALVNWPTPPAAGNNNERSGIRTSFGAVERTSDSRFGGETYLTDFTGSGGGIDWTTTDDRSGTLRLLRTGGTLSGSYWNGTDWTSIATYPAGVSGSMGFELSIWPWTPTPGVQVAFDNIYLSSDTEIAIPVAGVPEHASTLLLLGLALTGLAWAKRLGQGKR